jgi:tRNA threonylcarbamoyladenosine biosynthesis protein TsaB
VRVLGFDTSTRATSVALVDADADLALELRDDPPPGRRPGHASALLPMIAEILERAGGGWESVDRLAVGQGPGTFTGLRIGLATARALARARPLELVGISTLRSLAYNGAAEAGAETLLAVLDARRGEAFAAAWKRDDIALGEPVLEPAALKPEQLADGALGLARPVMAVGDGAVEFREVLERSGALVPDNDAGIHAVTAINHCRLASAARASDPDQVLPEYLRVPDAELTRRAKSTDDR